MHDMRETQDVEIAFDVNAAKFTDAAQIVAAQVDEHVVFGQFLCIVQEFIFQGLVFFRRLAPRPHPARGNVNRSPFSRRVSVSGEEPASSISSPEKKNIYGDGLRSAGRGTYRGGPLGFSAQAVGQDDLEISPSRM